jgi:DNA-binding MarR family transcriptional regulator
MNSAIQQLQELGFSPYEAQAYVALLEHSPLNGYELARESGVPRANIYSVLQKLEERGAVLRQETPEGVRYKPLAPAELVGSLKRRYTGALDAAAQALEQIGPKAEDDQIWSARGYTGAIENARSLIRSAREQLLIALYPPEAIQLAHDLAETSGRGVAVTTVCLAGCREECGACRGDVHRYRLAGAGEERWLVVVPDGEELLAGELKDAGGSQSVRTRQRMLVNLVSWYLRHHAALAAILADLGEGLEQNLDEKTLQALQKLGPNPAGPGWLETMRMVVSSSGSDRYPNNL